MSVRKEKVRFDKDKLEGFLVANKISKRQLSIQMGRSEGYLAQIMKRQEIAENEENLICLLLGVDQGTFVKKEEALTSTATEPKILQNIYREILELRSEIALAHKKEDKILEEIEALKETAEKTFGKVNANTIQLEKIKESVKILGMSGFEKAMLFLEETLKDGKALESEVTRKGDAIGLSMADLNKAKRELGVNVVTTGYGKNQKKWMVMS